MFDKIKYIYFLGIGGIGMSALARYFNATGKKISGYDKTKTILTGELESEGIQVHYEDDIHAIAEEVKNNPHDTLVVMTPAVPPDHSELNYFKQHHFTIKKRSEVLGMITHDSFTIAVAGTHGKTTTSSLIAHILQSSEVDCTAFLGGITQNYGTNLLLSNTIKEKNPSTQPIVVVEADEYDRSFLTLHPDIAVITSVDADHLDIYEDKKNVEKSYAEFASQLKPGGVLILKKGVDKMLVFEKEGKKIQSYSVHQHSADYYARKITIKKGNYVLDVVTPDDVLSGIALGIPGKHNVENSIAAIAVAQNMNVFSGNIKNALATFKGVKRRFEYHIKTTNLIYIDDYAHHPEELRACISAVKEMYPSKKVSGIFQPHLFTRTRDFADEFARSLALLDSVLLLDIYPAREKPIEGVTSEMLLNKIAVHDKKVIQKKNLISELSERKLEVLLTLGAGDIDTLIDPIKKELLKRYC
jgi:UDP-N-acetylmuramate--alanine ligase